MEVKNILRLGRGCVFVSSESEDLKIHLKLMDNRFDWGEAPQRQNK